MHVVEAQVQTELASRYLVQLCKHFAHKVATDYDSNHGRVEFQPGSCVMRADGNQLHLRCEANTEPDMHIVKNVVEGHLVRFARDEAIAVMWSVQTPADMSCRCAR